MSSLLRIRQIYSTLAQNDRKLADFLLINPEQARHLSSQSWRNRPVSANLLWSNLPKIRL